VSAVLVDNRVASPGSTRELVIDFLYLDLETCTRCRGTDANLEAALAQVGHVLDAAGMEVAVRKTLVASAEQAQAVGFVSSPTIRVNGQDIALELRESSCAECGEACGCDGAIDCRVWVWEGQEYTQAPPAMIVDALLRAVYGGSEHAVAAPSVAGTWHASSPARRTWWPMPQAAVRRASRSRAASRRRRPHAAERRVPGIVGASRLSSTQGGGSGSRSNGQRATASRHPAALGGVW
jgi:hypothetical protein